MSHNMKLVSFNEVHYPLLIEWWTARAHAIIPRKSLCSIGVVAYKKDTPIAMSFLYTFHNCDMSQIAWTTTNPETSARDNHEAVNLCLNGLIDIAKLNNKNMVVSFSKSSGLTRMFKKKGFAVNAPHDFLIGNFSEDTCQQQR